MHPEGADGFHHDAPRMVFGRFRGRIAMCIARTKTAEIEAEKLAIATVDIARTKTAEIEAASYLMS